MADGDTIFGGGGDGSDLFGGSLFSQPNLLNLGSTTTTTAPSTDTGSSLFKPSKPNYLASDTGMGSLQKILRTLYDDSDNTTHMPVPAAESPEPETATTSATPAATGTAGGDRGYQTTREYLEHGADFVGDTEHDRMVGSATTFGLDYDTGGNDAMDNGIGAFGHNTRDKNLEGASLPIAVVNNSIGDYQHDPKIFDAIKRGDYKVAVTNADGTTKVVPIVDVGPAEWTGNAIDLTYRTSHELGTEGKAKVGYQIIGPDGDTVKIKGFHPHSVERGNWHDHIPNGGAEEKPAEQPAKVSQEGEVPEEPVKPAKPTPSEKSLSANTGAGGTSASKNKKPRYVTFNVATGNYDLQYDDGTKQSVPLAKYNESTGEILP
jgi:hypothetical protein